MKRIVKVIEDIVASNTENTIIVAHGGIVSLVLNYYDLDFGFEEWRKMSNPDVYQLRISQNESHCKRLWKD